MMSGFDGRDPLVGRAVVILGCTIAGLLVVAVLGLLLEAAGGDTKPPEVSTAGADPADVAAAHACRTYLSLLQGHTDSKALAEAVKPLVAGADQARSAGRPAPRWAALGGVLTQGATDHTSGAGAETIKVDNEKVLAGCNTIPPGARKAGGYSL